MRRFIVFPFLILCGLAMGCASPDEGEDSPATILSFEALPPTIDPGMSATLRWEVRGASRIAIVTTEGEKIALDAAALEARQVEVQPTKTTTYRLVAHGKGRNEVARETRVSVRAERIRISSFEAEPTTIRGGESTTLSWTTQNATAVHLFANDAEVSLGGAAPEAGSVELTPGRTTTYTLRASNPAEVAEAKVTVEVRGGLEVELSADRSRIEFGQETMLRWRARNATRIEIQSGGEALVESSEPTGAIAVAPLRTTTYEVTAHGEGRTSSSSVTIRVAPVIERFAASDPGPLARGEAVELGWEVRGAEGVRISTADDWSFEGDASGEVEAEVPGDGRFHLRAWLGDEEATQTLQVALLERPEVVAFTVTPASFTLPEDESAEVLFAWSTLRASGVEIRDEGGALVTEGPPSGEARIALDRGGRFTLTAANAAGTANRVVEVKTYLPPAIDAFVAWPSHVAQGEAFELRWRTRGTAVEIERDGTAIHSGPGGEGSLVLQLAADATFRLRAANELGAIVEEELVVTVGPPSILSFTADRLRHGPGSTVHLSWTALGGKSIVLTGPDGVVCTTNDPEQVSAGECPALLPGSQGVSTFTLTLTNGLGQSDASTLDVEVVDGPAILNFYADRSRITLGDELTFYWTTGVDADGQAPTLVLSDGPDTYDLGGADPLAGSVTVVPLQPGARTFRLTASTPGTTSAAREVAVSVLEPPQLTVIPPATGYVPGEGPVSLGWQAAHATEVEVFELNDLGATSVGLFVDPVLVAHGSADLLPPSPGATYRVVARNDVGASVEEEVYVAWALPEIAFFAAAPEDVVVGGVFGLQWEATEDTRIELSPRPLVPSEPFEDLAEVDTATEIALTSCGPGQLPNEACAIVPLPFSFAFGGQTFNQALIHQNGTLGFDTSYQGGFAGVAELPSPQASHVALAPFWQPLRTSVPGSARTGRILYHADVDAKGSRVVIQWEGFWSEGATAANPVDLNFQVVLYADGDFDFRYGKMEGPAGSGVAEGAEASIGYQFPGGAEGRSISFQQELASGLAGLSFGPRWGPLPSVGALEAISFSLGSTVYELTAENDAGVAQAQATVTTHAPVRLENVQVVEPFPEVNVPYTLTWTATGASLVRVEQPRVDPNDPLEPIVVLCEVAPADPQSCAFVSSSVGTVSYVVRALGLGAQDEVEETIQVEVLPAFSLASFTASPNPVLVDEEVTLSWTTVGATSISLTANGAPIDVSSLSPLADSIDVVVSEDTTFVFTATSHGRVLFDSIDVVVEEPPEEDDPPEDEDPPAP